MAKRLFDACAAAVLLVALAPIIAIVAVGIRLTSPGCVIYRTTRVGRHKALFTMYKFRTMRERLDAANDSSITAHRDARVFPFGALLRRLKLDELPQLLNILKGEMSFVGPRPEEPYFVDHFYAPVHFKTLSVLPGLASPGSLYNYTHLAARLPDGAEESFYISDVLPLKLALDILYALNSSPLYDMRIVVRTAWAIIGMALGRTVFPEPPELESAHAMICPARTNHLRSC